MNISRSLKDELYRFTEECKKESANKRLISRYIFKPSNQVNKEPEGSLNFIDSNKLYSYDFIDSKEIRDLKSYFKYNSINNRFLSKDINVCDLPITTLEKHDCQICALSSSEDIISRDNDITHTNGHIPLKQVFGKKYNSNSFLNNTGVLITVYRIGKHEDGPYYTAKIHSDDVNIIIMSSNYYDISFTDYDPSFAYYIIEICKVCDSKYNNDTDSEVSFINSENGLILDMGASTNDDAIYYNNRYYQLMDNKCFNVSSTYDHTKITIVNNIFDTHYIDKSQFIIWYNYTYNGKKCCMLVPTISIDGYEIDQNRAIITITTSEKIPSDSKFTIYCIYDKYESEYTEKTLPDILKDEGISDDIISKIKMPNSSNSETYDSDLIKYYPNFLKEKLDRQCPTYYGIINEVYTRNIIHIPKEGENGSSSIACARFEIPIKHSSIMFFQKGKIIDPVEYFEGEHYINGQKYGSIGTMSIYVDARNLDSENYDLAILNNDGKYILDDPIYVISTETFFNEDVTFPLIEIDKYLPYSESDRYSFYAHGITTGNPNIVTDDFGNSYYQDDNGIYLRYKNSFYPIEDIGYTKSYNNISNTDLYEEIYIKSEDIIDSDKISYCKVKSSEYIIPVNKNLTKEKLAIMVERMEQVSYLNAESYETNDIGYNFVKQYDDKRHVLGVYWRVVTEPSKFVIVQRSDNLVKENNKLYLNYYDKKDNTNKKIQIEADSTLNPIRYERAIYKYSKLLNNINYYTEQSDRNLYKKDYDGNYVKCKKDLELAANFKKYNEIIKIRIANGEIIDCGFANTDEYLDLIDTKSHINRDGTISDPAFDHNIDLNANILNADDGRIVAYNISNGYSQYFINNDNEQFLSYVIPTQLIASESKLLAFMDGILTDEFIIDKHLYYRLFDGNTILAFSDEQSNPETGKFVYDPNGDYVYDGNGHYILYDDIVDGDTLYCGVSEYQIPRFTLVCDKNGTELLSGGSSKGISEIPEPSSVRYSKVTKSIYVTNPGSYTLYQDIHGISYEDGIFTLSNEIDGCVSNEQKMYDDFYMLPFSPNYMMLFINGRYISPDHIKVLSTRRFALIDTVKTSIKDYFNLEDNESLEINEIFIYRYDYINPFKYIDYFVKDYGNINASKYIPKEIYKISDYLWDDYGNELKEVNKDKIFTDIIIDPKDPGFHQTNNLIAMYEIFGKYVLNKYDIDANFDLADEVRSYFSSLYDEDGRMKLELILDNLKRKYNYGRYVGQDGIY